MGLAGFLLVLVAALGAQAEPPSSTLPGRTPDSKEPWEGGERPKGFQGQVYLPVDCR